MKPVVIAQIGMMHDHATSCLDTLLMRPDLFDFRGVLPVTPLGKKAFDGYCEKVREVPALTLDEIFAIPDLEAVCIETEEELSTIAENIKKHRATEKLILEGDLYRCENTLHGNLMSQTVVSKDKKQAMLVFYQALNPHNGDLIARAAGLDPDKHYRIEELDLILSGSVLCNVGFYLERMPGDFDAVLFTLRAID